MDNFDRSFKWFNRIFWTIFTFTFIMIVCWFGLIGYLAYKGATEVNHGGVKSVAEKLWCGEQKDCKLPF